ncbi:MAG: DUF4255 domain-containing protein [Jatrophihabitantaceae bacterium]
MSGHSAIAAVTLALQSLLQDGIAADGVVTGGQVTTKAPDLARVAAKGNQVNLFLYRTAIDPAWRNQDPVGVRPGELAEPALPLILSYLVTAYGQDDDDVLSHRLLGITMSVLNDRPILSRSLLARALPGSGLDVQSEAIRIVAHPIPQDEISRLWATFQTGYRISATYDVAVVLIDSSRPVLAAPPVLARGADDAGPFASPAVPPDPAGLPPVLLAGSAPGGRPSLIAGEQLSLTGQNLGAVTALVVSGLRLAQPRTLAPSSQSASQLTVTLPDGDQALPAGAYTLQAVVGAGPSSPTSRPIPFAVRPEIDQPSPIMLSIPAKSRTVKIQLSCRPATVAGQSIVLVVSDRPVTGTVDAADPTKLSFELTDAVAGRYALRLRIDAQDSLLVDPANPSSLLAFHVLELTG